MREKVGKSRNTVFFQWFVAPEGRKVGSLKRRVRSQLATGAMKNCTPLCREAHFEVKSVKNWRSRTTFGSWDVKKVHAVVARSTFPSQNVQNTPGSDHFWKLRCWKSARRCGAKHISKSKCTKHGGHGQSWRRENGGTSTVALNQQTWPKAFGMVNLWNSPPRIVIVWLRMPETNVNFRLRRLSHRDCLDGGWPTPLIFFRRLSQLGWWHSQLNGKS